MKRVLLVSLLMWSATMSAAIQIQDTVYTAIDGQLFNGRMTISAPDMTTPDGRTVVRWTKEFTVANGVINVSLEPNDSASPAGTSYAVRFTPAKGPAWTERWIVPTSSTPLKVHQVRVTVAPVPDLTIQPTQIRSGGAAQGQCLAWSGSAWQPADCGATGAVVSVFGRTAAVTAQTGDYSFSQISGTVAGSQLASGIEALKIGSGSVSNTEFGYLDGVTAGIQQQLDGKAASSHTHSGSEITSGTISEARIDAALTRDSELAAGLAAKADGVHVHSGEDVTSGIIAEARIASEIARDSELAAGLAAKADVMHDHTLGGDLSGSSLSDVTVTRLQGRSMALSAPSDGQVLMWSASNSQWQPGSVSGSSEPENVIRDWDEWFGNGNNATSPTGRLNWTVRTDNGVANYYGVSSHGGTTLLGVAGLEPHTPNGYAVLHLGAYNMDAKWFVANALSEWEFQYAFRTELYYSSEVIWLIGLADSISQTPANSILVRFRNNTGCTTTGSDSAWIYSTCSGGTCTTQSSGVSVSDGSVYRVRIRKSGSGVGFSMCSGSPFCTLGAETVISTNLPSATPLVPYMLAVGCASGYRRLFVDRFSMMLAR